MKKIDFKPIIITIGLLIFQAFIYLLTKLLEGDPHIIGNSIDSKIPFSIYAIIPYCIWYFMLFIVPYIIYKRDKNIFTKYCISFICITLVSNILFVIYPTTVANVRPTITGNSILELIARFIFWIDTPPINCFPSLHCGISMLWLLYILYIKQTNIYEKIIIPIISILIMISTLCIKQHVFIDLVSGDIIAIIIFTTIIYEKNLTNKFKKLLNI